MVSRRKIISLAIVLAFIFVLSYIDLSQITSSTYEKPSFLAETIQPPSNSTCYSCHSNLSGVLNDRISGPATQWQISAHYSSEAVVMCFECHGGNPNTFVISDAKSNESGYIEVYTPQVIIDICGKCHKQQYEEFQTSIHWTQENNETRLVCFDCHSNHNIKTYKDPESPTNKENEPKTCGKCHEEQYNGYYQTFHGKYLNLGNNYVASCSDCHHTHNILPQSHPNSTTNKTNLGATCATCHDNENLENIARGYYHYNPEAHTPNLIFDKGDLDDKEEHYFIGPFDIAYFFPFVYGIVIVLFVFTLVSFIFMETVVSKFFRRGKNNE